MIDRKPNKYFNERKASLTILFIPIALRKAKIAYNFGLSECNRVNLEPVDRCQIQNFDPLLTV